MVITVFIKKSYLSSWVFTAMQLVHIRMNPSLSRPLKKILDPPMLNPPLQTGVSIWGAVQQHSMDGWALSGADVQVPWHGVLEIVWLHCDDAQQVGCLRGLEGCPLVWDAGIQSQFARRRWWWGQGGGYEHCGTKQERSTLQSNGPGLEWLFATLLLQRPNRSQQAASGVRNMMLALAKW